MAISLSETMEDWDQETLEKVVESKKTEYNQNKPTDIVSFIRFVGDLELCCFCILSLRFSVVWVH